MRRRQHLLARLNRLDPPPVGGGVLHIEDLESGAVHFEDLPIGRAGYLLVNRPKATEEWIRAHAPIQLEGWIQQGRREANRQWLPNTKV